MNITVNDCKPLAQLQECNDNVDDNVCDATCTHPLPCGPSTHHMVCVVVAGATYVYRLCDRMDKENGCRVCWFYDFVP